MLRYISSVGLLLIAAGFTQKALAQTAVVAQLTADGQVKFERAEDLLINENKKIKLAPESEPRLDPIAAKSLQHTETNQAGLLRGDGKGRLYRVNTDGSTDRVLPENLSIKTSIQAATASIPLTISLIRNKKDKDQSEVPANRFYLYVADSDPEHTALGFVLNPKNFVDKTEQLHIIDGFAKSFQSSPVAADLRRALTQQLESARNEYDDGGTFEALLGTQKLAAVAHQAFASDTDLTRVAGEINDRIQSTQTTERMLAALADAEDWSTFRTVYRKIEVNQDSFPGLRMLYRRALEEETRERCERARVLILRHRDSAALDELAAAALLDPENQEIPKLAEKTRMLAAQRAAKQTETSRKTLPKDSPEERRFRQALYYADRAIQDHDYARAADSIKEAEREDAGSPEILLAKASLAAATDEIPKAIPLLDEYDRSVVDSAAREKGDTVRNQVLYELRKHKQASKLEIDTALKEGDYGQAYKQSTAALKIDQNNTDFLYSAGLSAAVLHKQSEAKGFLESYLQYSDNLASNEAGRVEARKLIRLVNEKEPVQNKTGSPNWFSGYSVSPGVYYCPRSLAFQLPVESVSGFKFRMNYNWVQGRLRSIRTEFEDDKGKQDYLQIAAKTARTLNDSQIGNFFFVYDGDRPAVRAVYAGAVPADTSTGDDVRVIKNEEKSFKVVDKTGNPLVVLEDNPWLDLKVVGRIMGPAATIVSGNSFFNPFIWDGVHYFTVSYDAQGRASVAKEWNANNVVHFSWDGERLTEINAYHAGEGEAYYRRTISYTGSNISSEEYKSGTHGGHIKYVLSKDALVAKLEDNGVHDGKTWTVRIAERK